MHGLKFIQNSGLVPKKRASRNAGWAVTDRLHLTIAPMRVAGTRNAVASTLRKGPRYKFRSQNLPRMGGHTIGGAEPR